MMNISAASLIHEEREREENKNRDPQIARMIWISAHSICETCRYNLRLGLPVLRIGRRNGRFLARVIVLHLLRDS